MIWRNSFVSGCEGYLMRPVRIPGGTVTFPLCCACSGSGERKLIWEQLVGLCSLWAADASPQCKYVALFGKNKTHPAAADSSCMSASCFCTDSLRNSVWFRLVVPRFWGLGVLGICFSSFSAQQLVSTCWGRGQASCTWTSSCCQDIRSFMALCSYFTLVAPSNPTWTPKNPPDLLRTDP